MLTVVCLGCGGGIPMVREDKSFLGNTNFAIVKHDSLADSKSLLQNNPFWLVDCGPETVLTLVKNDAVKNLQGIFLTHIHTDHTGGLASLAYRLKFIEKFKVPLLVPSEIIPLLTQQLVELFYLGQEGDPSDLQTFFDVHLLGPDISYAGLVPPWPFKVTFFPVDHSIPNFPCFGIRLTTLSSKQILFSGDTAFPVKGESDTTVIFHDVQTYTPKGVHCPYSELQKAFTLGIRHKVVLCHTDYQTSFVLDGFGHAGQWDNFLIEE